MNEISIKKKVVIGDFLTSFAYRSNYLFHSMNGSIYFVPKKMIVDSEENTFKNILEKEQVRHFKMDQLMTDFDIYNDILFYCNSAGVFSINLNEAKQENAKPNKIMDAYVQCIKAGANGRIALSASSDGLFEYDIPGKKQITVVGKENKDHFFNVSNKHSTSCRWTNGNIWNYSVLDKNSLFEFVRDKEDSSKYYLEGEYTESDLFSNDMNNHSVFVSERNTKIYRFIEDHYEETFLLQIKRKKESEEKQNERLIKTLNENEITSSTQAKRKTSLEDKPNEKQIKTQNKIDNYIAQGEIYDFGEIWISEKRTVLFVLETNRGIAVIDKEGNSLYSNDNVSDIVSWRVFSNSRTYSDELHITFNDRIEILTFD